MIRRLAVLLWVGAVACGRPVSEEHDSGVVPGDSGVVIFDSGVSVLDAGVAVLDAGEVLDAGMVFDAGLVLDAGLVDSGVTDSGVVDAGTVFDAGVADAGVADAGLADAGVVVDAGTVFDAGQVLDAGSRIIRFVAFGDQGKGNEAQFKVGASVGSVCASRGCDFVLLLGDNFYPSGVTSVTDPLWDAGFVQPYASVDAGFYVTLGNHDYGANGAGTDFGREQNEIDYSAVNPKWILPAAHHKFIAGPAEFFSADTNRSMFRSDSAVRASFDAWLPASTSTWKIVFGHHTYRSNGPHGNAGNYDYAPINIFPFDGSGVKSFIDDRVCGRADVYLCGHDHVREWLTPTCTRSGSSLNTELIVSGGGASVTGFDSAGMNPYYWRAETSGFLYVVIEDRTFTGTFYNSDGLAEFTRTITK